MLFFFLCSSATSTHPSSLPSPFVVYTASPSSAPRSPSLPPSSHDDEKPPSPAAVGSSRIDAAADEAAEARMRFMPPISAPYARSCARHARSSTSCVVVCCVLCCGCGAVECESRGGVETP
jgi:hypothetical protein